MVELIINYDKDNDVLFIMKKGRRVVERVPLNDYIVLGLDDKRDVVSVTVISFRELMREIFGN